LLGLVLAAVGAFALWNRAVDHRRELSQQTQLLQVQAQSIDESLTRQLFAATASLRGVRADFPDLKDTPLLASMALRLRALSAAMPGVRTLLVLSREGKVIAANRAELVGHSFQERPYFQQAKADPDPKRLSLSRPFMSSLGVYSMNLTVALVDGRGDFDGVITATLSPDYFQGVMHALNFAPDMRAAVMHGEGDLLLYEPPNDEVVGLSLNKPGTFFTRHREAATPMSVLSGTSAATGDERLMVLRTIQPAELNLDHAIVIAVSRDLGAVFAPWWRQTWLEGGLYLLLVVASVLGLIAMRRRQSVVDRLRAERHQAERRSAGRLELALRGADLGLWDLEVPTGKSYVSERWCSMLGLRHEALSSSPEAWKSRVHPDDWSRVSEAQERHLKGQDPRFDVTYRMAHADGRWIWVLDRAQVLERDDEGRPLRMVGTHLDVTEAMEARLKLERSEQSLATTLNSIGDAVIATDAQGRVVRMNPAAEALTGWPLAEALGRSLQSVFRLLDAHTRSPAANPVQRVIDEGGVVGLGNDMLLLARDGSMRPVSDSAAPIRDANGAMAGVVLVFSDVSERYEAQRVLRENEARLRSLLANLQSGVVVHDRHTRVLQANPAACRLLGLSLDQMLGKAAIDPHWAFLEDDETPMPQARFPVQQVLGRGLAIEGLVVGIRRPDLPNGAWSLCNAFPLLDAQGEIDQVVVTISDITEIRQAEQDLRLIGAAVGRLNDLVVIFKARSEPVGALPGIVFVNPAFEQTTGWSREEVAGLSPLDLLADSADAAEAMRLERALRGSGHFQGELLYQAKSGREFWVEIELVPVLDRLGLPGHFAAVKRDITARKRQEAEREALEQQLRTAQKMESIGTLAGGIAHDFNNILAAILGNTALAQGDLTPGHPALLSLEQIQRAGQRGRHLVQQILAFSRRDQPGLVVQALAPIVEESISLLRAILPAGVQLESMTPAEPVHVRADSTQILQVLLNLCTNAWQALPSGGGHIQVGLVALEPDAVLREAVADLPDGPCVHVWVRDDGSGMDEATQRRVFDPFFTTKPVGQGTGLGLSVVHGILRAHGAAITVESAPGCGTTFNLYFPLQRSAVAALASPAEAPESAAPGLLRALYIDDDEVMVLMVERMLQRAGFQVTTETDAAAALARLRADPEFTDVVVTDYNMPYVSGFDVATGVAAIRPGLPVVLSTGFVSDALRKQAAELGIRAVLQKENSLEELAPLLRRLLAPAGQSGA
jgi:PAS domain S-box-containing protein